MSLQLCLVAEEFFNYVIGLKFRFYRERQMLQLGCLLFTFIYCCTGGVSFATADNNQVHETVDAIVATIKLEQQALKDGSAWEREEARLLDEIRQAKLEEAWYATQVKIISGYNNEAKKRIVDLESKRDNLQKIEAGLEGELFVSVEKFSSLVANDLPFLLQERSQRVNFLHQTLADYELDSAEKLRRVLEGMQVELSYGKEIELGTGAIKVDGVEQLVQFLRLGRVGIYALAVDGERGWTWNRDGGYRQLLKADVAELNQAVDMVARQTVNSVPNLPVSMPVGGCND